MGDSNKQNKTTTTKTKTEGLAKRLVFTKSVGKVGTSVSNTSQPSTSGTSKSAGTLGRPGSSGIVKPVPSCGQGRPSSKRGCPPSKLAYNERRKAYKVVERVGSLPVEERTEADLQSLEWAKKVIDEHDEKKLLASKRQRSVEEESQVVKRPKVGTTSTIRKFSKYSEVLKQAITVGILDDSNPDGIITAENWRKVEDALLSVFEPVMTQFPGPPPVCRDAGWHRGCVKLIACDGQRSETLYREAISRLGEIWPGASLRVVRKEEIPSRPRARAWVPAGLGEPDRILQIIRISNPDLPTQSWKIGKVEDPKGEQRQVLLLLNRESLPILARTQGVISFGFGAITLKVYRRDEEGTKGEKVGNAAQDSQSDPGKTSEGETSDVVMGLTSEEELLDSDSEGETDVTVVEGKSVDESRADQPPSQ